MKIIITIIFLFISFSTLAATPTCYSTYGGYCQYTGKVWKIYVNDKNMILIYFDSTVPLNVPLTAGLTITQGDAASFNIGTNPEYARLLYATALEAQASGRAVSMQMHDVYAGYLEVDRISLKAP